MQIVICFLTLIAEQEQVCSFDSQSLNESLEKIVNADEKRAKEVSSFYFDYQKSIQNVAQTIRKGGYACYVVGNRKVKSEVLPTDEITKDFFEKSRFFTRRNYYS